MHSARLESVDTISGIMITWMVIYHSFQWSDLIDSNIFHSLISVFFFFIPWFYFKAGLFFSTNKSIKVQVASDFGRVIVPFIVWGLIGYLISAPRFFLIDNQPIWKFFIWPFYSVLVSGDNIGNGPLWFLLSLFFVKAFSCFVLKMNVFFKFVYIIFLLIVGWFLSLNHIVLPLGLSTIPIGFSFFVFGVLLRGCNVSFKPGVLMLVSAFFLFLFKLYFNSYIDVHRNSIWFGGYFSYVFQCFFAILFSLCLFSRIQLRVFSWLGRNSLFILLLHWPSFMICYYLKYFFISNGDGGIFLFMLLIFTLILLVFLVKYTPSKIRCFMGLTN